MFRYGFAGIATSTDGTPPRLMRSLKLFTSLVMLVGRGCADSVIVCARSSES